MCVCVWGGGGVCVCVCGGGIDCMVLLYTEGITFLAQYEM